MTRGPDRVLVQRAARLLAAGPRHTLELAQEVLGLQGNPSAASAAVFTLLGADARFDVDGEGNWALHGPPPGTPLGELAYTVVDVETTGGPHRRGHRMTEIALYEIDGGAITGEWQTLINPGRTIPPRIEVLTGISNAMVRQAPYFDEVAPELLERLRGRIFVAHNVRFDWGFVAPQLVDTVGEVPRVDRLCTIRMARRLLPRLRRRNLDMLTAYFGIPIEARHRAWGDALATARVFLRLLDRAEQEGVVDLEGLQKYLRKSPRRKRPRQGQQLSLLDRGDETE